MLSGLRRPGPDRRSPSSPPTPCTPTSPTSPAPGWSTAGRRADFSLDADAGWRDVVAGPARDHLPLLAQQPDRHGRRRQDRAPGARLRDRRPRACVVVDEAYGQFADWSAVTCSTTTCPLVVTRTFSKTWSMAGVRLGYALVGPARGRRHAGAGRSARTTSTPSSRRPVAWPCAHVGGDGGAGGRHRLRTAAHRSPASGGLPVTVVAVAGQLRPVPPPSGRADRGVAGAGRPLGAGARHVVVAGSRRLPAGHGRHARRRTTASSPPSQRCWHDRDHERAPEPTPSAAGRPRRPRSTSPSTSTATGTGRGDDRPPVLRPHGRPARQARRVRPDVQATGDVDVDTHHTVEDVGIAPRRDAARGPRRQGRGPALRVDRRAPRRDADRRGPRPVGAPLPRLRGRSRRRRGGVPARSARLRPAAGRGVLAGLRHLGGHHPAPADDLGPQHPPHPRGQLQGRGPGPARRRAHRGRRTCRPPRGRCEHSDAAPGIAVLDYGIGNLRSAEKALQHVGADARADQRPRRGRRADGVVLPGVGAFGRCMEALRASRPRPGWLRRCGGRREAVPRRSASGCRCSTRAPTSRRAWPASASSRAHRPLPAGRKRPQMQWNRLRPARPGADAMLAGSARSRGCTSSTPTPLPTGRRRRHLRLRRPRGGRRGPGRPVGHPVPPGEVRATGPGWPSSQLRRRCAGHRRRDRTEPPTASRAPTASGPVPAIDLRGGRLRPPGGGRLRAGDGLRRRPRRRGPGLRRAGAPWIHVVDLDAARTGEPGQPGRHRGRWRRR